jgi:K+-transporting ATPase ATPase C chain
MGLNMKTINFWNEIKISFIAALMLLLLVSGVYPLIIWGIAQTVFPRQSNGSLIKNDRGVPIGSALLAQRFTSAKYFHPRPSVAGRGYDSKSSGGGNLGQTSQALMDTIKARVQTYRAENELDSGSLIPGDAVTASASGLDPDISFDNALLQVPRVAKARHLAPKDLEKLVKQKLQGRDLGVLGEPRINVFLLNAALDEGH